MTRKEFERLTREIEGETFVDDHLDPITFGIRRALFEQRRYARLVDLAAQAIELKTVKAKHEIWKRQLERAKQAQSRFEQLRRNNEEAGALATKE